MKAFIIHAEKFTERKKHIEAMMSTHSIQYEYMKKGAGDSISEKEQNKYFKIKAGGEKMMGMGAKCCTLQHFYVYEKIVQDNMTGALILEDDAVLADCFDKIFHLTMDEYEKRWADKKVIISYEDSRLRFVPRSKRKKGRYLYPGDRDRMAGIYFINRLAAQMILDDLKSNKCSMPIDIYHRHLLEQGKLTYLWCQPTIASQGSFLGILSSTLSSKKYFMEKLRWKFLKAYKKLIYEFR